jgi:hypothetical protein
MKTTTEKLKELLEAISKLGYPERDVFLSLLFRDEAKVEHLLDMFDLLEKPYPDWVRAYTNSSDFETGRSEAIDCLIGDFSVLGEI